MLPTRGRAHSIGAAKASLQTRVNLKSISAACARLQFRWPERFPRGNEKAPASGLSENGIDQRSQGIDFDSDFIAGLERKGRRRNHSGARQQYASLRKSVLAEEIVHQLIR